MLVVTTLLVQVALSPVPAPLPIECLAAVNPVGAHVILIAAGEDPKGPDPHDERHDGGLPANKDRDIGKAPQDPYGGQAPADPYPRERLGSTSVGRR